MANKQLVLVTRQVWASRNVSKDEQEEGGQMHVFVARLSKDKVVPWSDSPIAASVGRYYSGLRAACDIPSFIVEPDCELSTTVGHRIEYESVEAATAYTVVQMLDTLRDVERKLKWAHMDNGPVYHFAGYAALFAKAIGAKALLIECEKHEPCDVAGLGRRYRVEEHHLDTALLTECRKMEVVLQPCVLPEFVLS